MLLSIVVWNAWVVGVILFTGPAQKSKSEVFRRLRMGRGWRR
jgi:hypothetical protein